MTKQLSVSVTQEAGAPAPDVYTILADYRNHHPHILPPGTFKSLVVEEGGVGEGTVFAASLAAFGRTQQFRMRVTEPQPGRVLMESDLARDLVTTFTVTPTGSGRCSVTIATQWEAASGLVGWVENRMTPPFLRRVYREELALLDRYAQTFAAGDSPRT